jgi:transcriptional regulator with XRE-family HTH domain
MSLNLKDKLKIVRLLLGYRQADMAKLLDSNQGAIAKYETDKCVPRRQVIENFADKTKWPLEWLDDTAPLSGLFPCQILQPGKDYSKFALTTIKQELREALPVFLQEELPSPSNVFRIMDQAGEFGVYLIENATNPDTCIILFSPPQLENTIPDILTAQYLNIQDIPPADIDLRKAWRKPYMGKLADILKLAGIHTKFSRVAVPVSQSGSNPPQTAPAEKSINDGEDGQDELEKKSITLLGELYHTFLSARNDPDFVNAVKIMMNAKKILAEYDIEPNFSVNEDNFVEVNFTEIVEEEVEEEEFLNMDGSIAEDIFCTIAPYLDNEDIWTVIDTLEESHRIGTIFRSGQMSRLAGAIPGKMIEYLKTLNLLSNSTNGP